MFKATGKDKELVKVTREERVIKELKKAYRLVANAEEHIDYLPDPDLYYDAEDILIAIGCLLEKLKEAKWKKK